MEIPPEASAEISQLYQAVKGIALDLIRLCHDPNYETTQENIRREISAWEEETFQLRLFEVEAAAKPPLA